MFSQSPYQTYKRYRTLQTHRIAALPIVILMPHSACNCRCVMCDIWKDNKNLKQLTEADVEGLLFSLQKLGTKQVVLSGGEALLNASVFLLCRLLKKAGIKITLLSTGLLLKKYAAEIITWIDEVIVSLDGPETVHDRIRNIPGAFRKLQEGVLAIKTRQPHFRISARTVIHRLNFRHWPEIIETAKDMDLNRISFLPADVSSHAFNREVLWSGERQNEVLIPAEELPLLEEICEVILQTFPADFANRFIAEPPEKLRQLVQYYKAIYGLCAFPFKRCNAPWVSAVVEADGSVRPCFFHGIMGNIHQQSLLSILNDEKAVSFRRTLDMHENETCKRCVCSLHLSPRTNPTT